MNKSKVLCLFLSLVFMAFGSCQNQHKDELKTQLFKQIANDDLFLELQSLLYYKMNLIGTNQYDVKEVYQITHHNLINDICAADRQLFSKARGGLLFYEIQCQYEQLLDQLNEKYQYYAFPTQDKEEINRIYEENTKAKERQELLETITNHFENEKR